MVCVKIPKRGRASIKVAISLYLEDAIALLIFYRAIIFLFRRCDRTFNFLWDDSFCLEDAIALLIFYRAIILRSLF